VPLGEVLNDLDAHTVPQMRIDDRDMRCVIAQPFLGIGAKGNCNDIPEALRVVARSALVGVLIEPRKPPPPAARTARAALKPPSSIADTNRSSH
jgi:hypothetical protein